MRGRHLILSFLLLSCCFAVQAQQTESLQQRMTPAQFKAAGLEKLSPQELANLDRWLAGERKADVRVVDHSGKPVFYPEEKKREKFTAHLKGTFEGWSGNGTMTLDNGQVWKQNDGQAHSCMSVDNPEVRVKPALFGNWLMYVQGCNAGAHVERVR